MSTNLALNPGPQPQPDHRDRVIASLEQEVRSLRMELGDARQEAENARRQSERAVSNLRKQLTPLFRALQLVFGEIDVIAPETGASASANTAPVSDRKRAVWESWKQKLGGGNAAAFIDALLNHGELTPVQMRVAMGISRQQTVYDTANKLTKVGLLNKNGGKYSLKEL
jgi:hypothetical protein